MRAPNEHERRRRTQRCTGVVVAIVVILLLLRPCEDPKPVVSASRSDEGAGVVPKAKSGGGSGSGSDQDGGGVSGVTPEGSGKGADIELPHGGGGGSTPSDEIAPGQESPAEPPVPVDHSRLVGALPAQLDGFPRRELLSGIAGKDGRTHDFADARYHRAPDGPDRTAWIQVHICEDVHPWNRAKEDAVRAGKTENWSDQGNFRRVLVRDGHVVREQYQGQGPNDPHRKGMVELWVAERWYVTVAAYGLPPDQLWPIATSIDLGLLARLAARMKRPGQ